MKSSKQIVAEVLGSAYGPGTEGTALWMKKAIEADRAQREIPDPVTDAAIENHEERLREHADRLTTVERNIGAVSKALGQSMDAMERPKPEPIPEVTETPQGSRPMSRGQVVAESLVRSSFDESNRLEIGQNRQGGRLNLIFECRGNDDYIVKRIIADAINAEIKRTAEECIKLVKDDNTVYSPNAFAEIRLRFVLDKK